MVLPCEQMALRLETSNRPFFRISRFETLPVNMEVALVNVIQQELRVFKQLERLTYDLERRPDYSPLVVYRTIDRLNEGRIDYVNMDRFFKSNGLYLSEREIGALIRRIDTSGDQTVSYRELEDFLSDQVGFRSDATVMSLAKATP